jgi:hypothetical protein
MVTDARAMDVMTAPMGPVRGMLTWRPARRPKFAMENRISPAASCGQGAKAPASPDADHRRSRFRTPR